VKATQWAKAASPLLEALPSFHLFKSGLAREHRWVVECLYIDSSSFSSDKFSVEAFVLPLFIPTGHLYFNYGFRIGGQWDRVDDELISAVIHELPRLEGLTSWSGLIDCAADWQINVRHAELRLCVGILESDLDLIAESRRRVEAWQPAVAWETEVLSRCKQLLDVLNQKGRDAAELVLAARKPDVLALIR
jgi:hypothetical protein